MSRKLNIQFGQRFGRLVIVGELEPSGKIRRFHCLCDCGTFSTPLLNALRSGHTQSCGCLQHESITKHGLSKTPAYATWSAMITRCTNPDSSSYEGYGGRGITVCPAWLESVEQFVKDMGPREPHEQIDRIDNDGNYEPGNCRWVDAQTNIQNRGTAIRWFIRGQEFGSCRDAAPAFGVSYQSICNWVNDPARLDCYKKQVYPDYQYEKDDRFDYDFDT